MEVRRYGARQAVASTGGDGIDGGRRPGVGGRMDAVSPGRPGHTVGSNGR